MGIVCPFLPVHNNIVSCVTCFAGLSVSLPGSLKLGGESPECSVKKITKKRPGHTCCQNDETENAESSGVIDGRRYFFIRVQPCRD